MIMHLYMLIEELWLSVENYKEQSEKSNTRKVQKPAIQIFWCKGTSVSWVLNTVGCNNQLRTKIHCAWMTPLVIRRKQLSLVENHYCSQTKQRNSDVLSFQYTVAVLAVCDLHCNENQSQGSIKPSCDGEDWLGDFWVRRQIRKHFCVAVVSSFDQLIFLTLK